jgi:uncharacterized protein YraI
LWHLRYSHLRDAQTMPQHSQLAVSTSALSDVKLRTTLADQVLNLQVIDRGQVLEFIYCLKVLGSRPRVETYSLI